LAALVVKGAKVKILVADDEAVSRRLLQSYLQKWGHDVVVAENGAEAWRLFAADEFPIVITDWIMPELDGIELIRRIRGHGERGYVYTILLSAKSKKEDLVEGMEAGADDFLCKPFDRDELRVRLREGERIINLERTLAEQNRTLREAQSALEERDRQARLGRIAVEIAPEMNRRFSVIATVLTTLASAASSQSPMPPELLAQINGSLADIEHLRELVSRLSTESSAPLGESAQH
jgi:two-component system, NtrC family, sensor kinase